MELIYAILLTMAIMFPVAGLGLYINIKETREKEEKEKSKSSKHHA